MKNSDNPEFVETGQEGYNRFSIIRRDLGERGRPDLNLRLNWGCEWV